MTLDDVEKITVVGAGLMGHGIALEYALGGFHVTLNDINEAALDRGWNRIHESLELLRQCGFVEPEQADAALQRIDSHTELRAAVNEADIVVEAVTENLEQKQILFRQLCEYCPRQTIIASNSSSFTPSLMAEATTRPQQFLGTALLQSALSDPARRGDRW